MDATTTRWETFIEFFLHHDGLGLSADFSRIGLDERFLDSMEEPMEKALAAMDRLEQGAIANPDEDRMVGHYWLRAPELAPTAELAEEITSTLEAIKKFAGEVHSGTAATPDGQRFKTVLSIGIGGSALGVQFVSQALATADDPLSIEFFDNTDPEGFDRTLGRLDLRTTLVLVISKSGGTPETLNGMLEAQAAFQRAGLSFARQAVAITGVDSKLDRLAREEGWLARFPMWDWVGGRTSVMSAVGLLPCGLLGFDLDAFLSGAAAMDEWTRLKEWRFNPAAMLALSWYRTGEGKGKKDMVILPYKDRLELFSRYLQQLVMESLGKAEDLEGRTVHQGIAVYGNKGSTDQHAYVQQLRDGVHNFFATFIVVLKDRDGDDLEVEAGITSGDFLSGFWQGTRQALTENGRGSITLTVPEVSARTVGALIALYERAVGFYAVLVNINAYHQPGVEAGKKAAGSVLNLQKSVVAHLQKASGPQDAGTIAQGLGRPQEAETVFHICRHLAANQRLHASGSGVSTRFSL